MIPLNKTTSSREEKEQHHSEERPNGLQLLVSQAVVSNCRVGDKCSQADILNDLQSFVSSRQYADMSCYPNEKQDMTPFSNAAWLNDYSVNCHQLQNLTRRDKGLYGRLKRDGNLPHQIWALSCDQVWMEFIGVEKAHGRPITFVDAFPVRLWICQKVPYLICDDRSISPLSMASSVESTESFQDLEGSGYLSPQSLQQHRSLSVHSPPTMIDMPPNQTNNPQLRHSHSDSDLIDAPRTFPSSQQQQQHPLHAVSNTAITGGENYAWGGPPPPYGGSVRNPGVESVGNSPPTYDSITQEDSTDPGPIVKPPLEDCGGINLDAGNGDDVDESLKMNTASTALLMNVEKTVQVQLEHFQLMSLLRLGDEIGTMMARIELDNKERNTVLGGGGGSTGESHQQQDHGRSDPNMTITGVSPPPQPPPPHSPVNDAEQESVLLNISVPHVLIDLVLAPCMGIDPIQRLSLQERVEHEKQQKRNSSKKSSIDQQQQQQQQQQNIISSAEDAVGNELPMRSRGKSSVSSSPKSHSLTGTPNLSDNRSLVASTMTLESLASSVEPQQLQNPLQRRNSNNINTGIQQQQQQRNQAPSGYTKETFRDAQVQAGDPLVDANLRPSGENQLISVLRIHAESVKVGIESKSGNNVVKVTSNKLQLNELGNMKYGKVLDPRGSIIEDNKEQATSTVNMNSLTGDAMVKLRMTTGPEAEQFAKDGKEFGFADIRVSSLAAALLMSTVDNLTEFGEDEYVFPTMPFRVRVTGSDISMYDDKPRRSRSSIKLPPSHVVISDLIVERDSSGVVTLNPAGHHVESLHGGNGAECVSSSGELSHHVGIFTGGSHSGVASSLSSVSLSSSLSHGATTTSGSLSRDLEGDDVDAAMIIHQQVNALIGENGRLVEDLKLVNAKVNGMHAERESLLKVIDKLQKELMMSNRENDDLQNRMRSFSISSSGNHGGGRRPNQR